ncbi:rod shape-determining protein MreC [Thermodesulforhabdus norvegica]|uniref:Cell shape-determining protein MreC n=1 Tax=Thermodesulforhabdus norvegica TaxID=39841 RepID=A0A1I4VD74_9BACT|nr:rod shape-determining protein MreC [Thermodesulforhabdus norvegica]SFM99117.1 rod shape-determining protein MreC [Thermodesulforhabdus norvegica]
MWELIRRLRGFFFVLFFIIVAFYLFSLNFKTSRLDTLQRLVLHGVGPLAEGWTRLANGINNLWDSYINLVGVREENYRLKKRISQLEQLLVDYREAYLENQRLRRLLEFRDQLQVPSVTASIIFHDFTGWFQSVIINKGSLDGIKPDMPVVCYEGVVGRILNSGSRFARVMLVTDPASAVDVLVQRSRVRGILVGGEPGLCYVKYVKNDADVRPGDLVITTGKDGIFPRGLKAGIVTKVYPDPVGIFQFIEVRPVMEIGNLDEVLVLLKEPSLPPGFP